MKAHIIILLLLLFIPVTAAELTIEPDVVDTYFIYSGMGEELTSKYEFFSSHDIVSCEMIPQNDSVSCHIEEGYIIEVWFSTTEESYFGELQVTDGNETTINVPVVINTLDFGSYSEIAEIHIGNFTNTTYLNLFVSTDDGNIIGIRNWLIWWLFILFVFAVMLSFRK